MAYQPATTLLVIAGAVCANAAVAQPSSTSSGQAASTSSGHAYPNKPIRMIVISAPGGSTDLLSRTLGRSMTESMGQTVVLDNKPGGGGIIATETTAK